MIYDFGIRLRELRHCKKLTQAQVAKRLNLSKTTVSGYENNIKSPSLDTLAKLSNLYGVSTDYLLGIQNRKPLYLEDLTDKQLDLLAQLIHELRNGNK